MSFELEQDRIARWRVTGTVLVADRPVFRRVDSPLDHLKRGQRPAWLLRVLKPPTHESKPKISAVSAP